MLGFGASGASKGGWTNILTWKKQRQASRGYFFLRPQLYLGYLLESASLSEVKGFFSHS